MTYRRSWQCAQWTEQIGIQEAPPHKPCDDFNSKDLECGRKKISAWQIGFKPELEKESDGDRSSETSLEWGHCCSDGCNSDTLQDRCPVNVAFQPKQYRYLFINDFEY